MVELKGRQQQETGQLTLPSDLTLMERTLRSLNVRHLKVHMCFKYRGCLNGYPELCKDVQEEDIGNKRGQAEGGPSGNLASLAGAGLAGGRDQIFWPAGWAVAPGGCGVSETTPVAPLTNA